MSKRVWNEEQTALIELDSAGRPRLNQVAVRADAGAGKTTVLIERVRRLLEQPHAARLVCVSFTEKSKADLAERLRDQPRAEIYTIHGFCKRVIDEFGERAGWLPYPRVIDENVADAVFDKAFERVARNLSKSDPLFQSGALAALGFVNLKLFSQLMILRSDPIRGAELRGSGFTEAALAALRSFSSLVHREFDLAKNKMNALDYGDLEKVAVELLRNQEIADYFRKRYSDVFVDEFQDTNQAQCELVRSISSRNQGLFVVGDVKQSIYRFRGSDVRVFEEFVAEVSSQRVLSTNYRSHPAIIQAVNTVFDGVIRDFQPMRAFRKSEGGDRVFRVDANESAIGIAAAVARARSDGYAPGEIVLLLRRIRGNEKLLEDLRSYGINTVFSLPRDLTENPKLFALCSLWITLHFSDLRGPALHAVAELGITNEEIEDLASRVSETIICTSLLAAIDAQWSMHQRFGITWSLFGDLIYLAHETGMSGPGLAQEFLRLWQGRTPSGTLPLLVNSPEPPVTGSSSIRVTTVHSSKGMEYPVVILADLNDRRRSLGRVSLVKDHVWVFAPDSDGEIDRSSEHFKEALEEEKRESTDESNRLLYVALTRAKEQLYWVDVPGARGVRSGWCDLLHRKLLGQTAEITAASHSERFGEAEPTKVEPIETINDSAPIVPVVPSGIARIPVTEYIKLQRVRGSNKRTFAKDDPSQSDRTAQKGTVVHQYLQREAWEELWMYGDQENLDLSKFRAWLATESGRRVFDRKHAPIPQRLEREAAFEWLHDGHILSGAIDRLIVWSDEAWIIDYKLIQRRGGLGREELQHQYGPQLSLYASIVKKMTHIARTRLFIIDLLASSGEVWVELRQVDDTL